MNISGKTVLVSGANRGIGKAIVAALLQQGVKKVYAAARNPATLPSFGDARVVPLQLDITSRADIQAAVQQAADIDILINNAGALAFASIATGGDDELKQDMLVNYFGTLNVIRAFVPVLAARNGAAIANMISIVGLASMSGIGGYSASKAALHSATQALRAELKAKNISVHGVFPGPIDTDMAKEFPMAKASPEDTAANIVKGIMAGQEDIFPDPMSAQLSELYAADPKGLERQFAAM
jgi:NAD(P)-dependent dehydrogenase (short-subunit alcohol dehydrogenase family)